MQIDADSHRCAQRAVSGLPKVITAQSRFAHLFQLRDGLIVNETTWFDSGAMLRPGRSLGGDPGLGAGLRDLEAHLRVGRARRNADVTPARRPPR